MSTEDRSRREALLGGAGAMLAGLTATLAAASRPSEAQAQGMGDVPALNALLTAEYLAIGAYNAGAGILMSPPMGDPLASIAPVALQVAAHFRQQHQDHAARLVTLIQAAQGTPVSQAAAVFSPPGPPFTGTVLNVIRLAANKEKAAAVAYTKTHASISQQSAAEVIAAIGGVETQHFIVLYLLARGVVIPGMALGMNANDLVPRSFVAEVGAGTMGLDSVMDFTYAPLM
ncbi:MAG: ferritin-like domain-containing protein [Deltaproteobacteria bacterium]|nr:ferritin-like domain-containing protein [Deltaproteobacteria bacterium]